MRTDTGSRLISGTGTWAVNYYVRDQFVLGVTTQTDGYDTTAEAQATAQGHVWDISGGTYALLTNDTGVRTHADAPINSSASYTVQTPNSVAFLGFGDSGSSPIEFKNACDAFATTIGFADANADSKSSGGDALKALVIVVGKSDNG